MVEAGEARSGRGWGLAEWAWPSQKKAGPGDGVGPAGKPVGLVRWVGPGRAVGGASREEASGLERTERERRQMGRNG